MPKKLFAGFLILLSISADVTGCMLWATATCMLEIAFESIQILYSGSFCSECMQGEKTRIELLNRY